MSKFKDRLWRDLVREHGAELAQVKRAAAQRGRRARPRVLAGTTLGLAGVGITLAVVLSAASSSPAFAVTPNRDGTVQVVIQRLSGISGANTKTCLAQVRLDPRRIPADRMVVLPTVRAGHLIHIAPAHLVRGASPACSRRRYLPRACLPATAAP
ncbi:MAG: hypothetical protein M3065_00815 [Actinomycetota bacterium]|nr:hypothetical protein [Actinomycetota bacterium]